MLGYSKDASTVIYHIFVMFAYFFPVLGAVVADSWLGKYKTILYLSIVYAVGNILVAVTAIPTLGIPQRFVTIKLPNRDNKITRWQRVDDSRSAFDFVGHWWNQTLCVGIRRRPVRSPPTGNRTPTIFLRILFFHQCWKLRFNIHHANFA